MINKQNLWFITLFALILILGIYYISLPNETLPVFENNISKLDNVISVNESDVIIAMKLEEEEKILKELNNAKKTLINKDTSKEEKNNAYNTIKELNYKKSKVNQIEMLIKEKFDLDSCVKIEGEKINITVNSEKLDVTNANEIIKAVQSLYSEQMYITIKYQNK